MKWWNKEDDFTETAMWQQLKFNDFLNSFLGRKEIVLYSQQDVTKI